jgi:hypothetical protein
MNGTFKIYYDDQLTDVVDKITSKLEQFGLKVTQLDGGDGFEEYEITRTDSVEINDDTIMSKHFNSNE